MNIMNMGLIPNGGLADPKAFTGMGYSEEEALAQLLQAYAQDLRDMKMELDAAFDAIKTPTQLIAWAAEHDPEMDMHLHHWLTLS
jgi:hypothetical protein